MIAAATLQRSHRAAALITIIVLHVLLLLLFLTMRSAGPQPAQPHGALTVVSIAEQPEAVTPPPPPKLPSKVLKQAVQLAELALSTDTKPEGTAASASGCVTLATITKALLADPATVAAVLQAPPETRSIAEAIVIWNSGWSEAAASPGGPLELVRSTVSQSLATVDETCLDEPVTGPRLIAIPAGAGTMFLVFGSGSWTWRQVTADPEAIRSGGTPRPVAAGRPVSQLQPKPGAASF